jgi:hypothetical protein
VLNSRIMSYILNILICVGMILLDNLLQCFMFIDVIDLSRTCENTIILICNSLVMFMSFFNKIKLKVLIFPTVSSHPSIARRLVPIVALIAHTPVRTDLGSVGTNP